jgi:hypothetical protein
MRAQALQVVDRRQTRFAENLPATSISTAAGDIGGIDTTT